MHWGYVKLLKKGLHQGKMTIINTLKRAEVFLGLDDDSLVKIASLSSCREESYAAGQVIFRADDNARNIYVLKDGEIGLVTEVHGEGAGEAQVIVIDKLTRGSFLGWSALAEPHRYVMSAICQRPTTVVVINGGQLRGLFESDYRLGFMVYQYLTRIIGNRLRDMEQVLIKGKRGAFLSKQRPTSV
jgi:CRP/FNR family transcriptional regulator, cyclic AMP receptor protein